MANVSKISFLFLLCLTACNHATKKTSILQQSLLADSSLKKPLLKLDYREIESSLFYMPHITGEWVYSSGMFYIQELKINSDGTFHYFDRSCLDKGLSEGEWRIENNYLVLTSYEKYKSKYDTVPFNPTKLWVVEGKGDTICNDDWCVVAHSFKGVYTGNIFPDTSRAYFDKELFRMENDTLYQFDSKGVKGESKYWRPLPEEL